MPKHLSFQLTVVRAGPRLLMAASLRQAVKHSVSSLDIADAGEVHLRTLSTTVKDACSATRAGSDAERERHLLRIIAVRVIRRGQGSPGLRRA